MNNNKAVWIVLAVVVLAIILYFLLGHKKGSQQSEINNSVQSQSQSANSAQPASETSGMQSLKDLIAGGNSQKCTFSDDNSQGSFYVSAGKARGDFNSTVNGKTTLSHMIVDGQTYYMWTDGTMQGFKSTISATDTASVQSPAAASMPQTFDQNKKSNYSCSPWSADSSLFEPPSSVQFMDLSSLRINN